MKTYLWVENEKLLHFQGLVKQHNMRFEGGIRTGRKQSHVTVCGDHLSPELEHAFWRDWSRLNISIIETRASRSVQLLNRLKLAIRMAFKGLFS